jgi:hypothetical protein
MSRSQLLLASRVLLHMLRHPGQPVPAMFFIAKPSSEPTPRSYDFRGDEG